MTTTPMATLFPTPLPCPSASRGEGTNRKGTVADCLEQLFSSWPSCALTIRKKILLLSALLLAVPYIGYQYIQEMENYLREGLDASLLGAAQTLAGAMHDRADLGALYQDKPADLGFAVYRASPAPPHSGRRLRGGLARVRRANAAPGDCRMDQHGRVRSEDDRWET